MKKNDDKKTKEKIIEAAIELFYYQGFHGTTVRQIAQKANLNLALISYYFGGKKGLLEQLMVHFYEGYFKTIEQAEQSLIDSDEEFSTKEQMIHVMKYTFDYLFETYKMTRFIYRELTMDSMLIREIMTLYLSKEKYYYISILEEGVVQGEFTHDDLDVLVLQILHVLYMPFLQPQVIREVHYIEPVSKEFKDRYFAQLQNWITNIF